MLFVHMLGKVCSEHTMTLEKHVRRHKHDMANDNNWFES